MRSDPPRLRLDPMFYEDLRLQVLRRDGWRCQLSGIMSNLEVPHKQFRSHSGPGFRTEPDHAVPRLPLDLAWVSPAQWR